MTGSVCVCMGGEGYDDPLLTKTVRGKSGHGSSQEIVQNVVCF